MPGGENGDRGERDERSSAFGRRREPQEGHQARAPPEPSEERLGIGRRSMIEAPVLVTPRLRLRMLEAEDFEA